METILIKCPHCGEEMQAPVDRASILCMFCGEKIDLAKAEKTVQTTESTASSKEAAPDPVKSQENLHLTELKARDTSKKRSVCESEYLTNLQFIISHAGAVCKGCKEKVRAFKKDSYPGLFESHREENYAFYAAIQFVLENAAPEEAEEIYRQIAGAFISEQERTLGEIPKKNEKFSCQMDKNMFMVIYVIPSIKEIRDRRADRLAEVICEEWRKSFKDSNISASDYASIMEGFKRKLCYVTTAVCRNLNKGEDCEELRLIKDFRDGYLSSTKEGQALIEEYYDIAPTLVRRIDKDALAQAKYHWLWNTYLAPCVTYIKAGQEERCKETYCSMMEELMAEYMHYGRRKG